MEVEIKTAGEEDIQFAEDICQLMEQAALQRGTGIAKRSPLYISAKMMEGKSIIALKNNVPVGFCYIETWSHHKYVANSGLIVHPDFRGTGLGKRIKKAVFNLSRQKFPDAKIFGITTSLAVMKINSDLGYKPVTFSELTTDENFWSGCQSCKNFDILTRTDRSHCLCTGMLYEHDKTKTNGKTKDKERNWERFKRFITLHSLKAKRKMKSGFKVKVF
ncbi:GNAT family N-acetyltransferase [Fulvivirga sp. M361]|uniref:GNAT family N-acetyltransferase n=1 Tax=Fulvivirga sp. M361 TaxID=2594266 RepID=UPI00117BD3A6|nr:GNAT family N-acetyltransferase [Fulvivirga sp. M361]TRX62148.1 GNAT family N-acetyltransferase [Fulvivirga sp. M361]